MAESSAQGGELGARCLSYEGPAVASNELRDCIELEQPVEGRNRATRGGRRIQHGGHRPVTKRRNIAAIILPRKLARGSRRKGMKV
jgi:hypothetical protein